jgi:hypothetical protein
LSAILVVNWVSSCLSLFLSASTAATYIFTAPNYTTIIISLEPCALNSLWVSAFSYWVRFIKTSFTLRIPPLKEWIGGESRPKDKVKTGLLYG